MEKKFEPENTLEPENGPEPEQEIPRKPVCTGIYVLMVAFLILFLTTATLLIYYQFYMGKVEGKYTFEWSLRKKNAAFLTVSRLEKENRLLKSKLDSLPPESNTPGSVPQASLFSASTSGEVYYVQIGAFKTFDFSKYEPGLVNMFVDNENGMHKLIVGGFTDFNEACALRKDLIAIGFKNAYIIKKVDGKRVSFQSPCP